MHATDVKVSLSNVFVVLALNPIASCICVVKMKEGCEEAPPTVNVKNPVSGSPVFTDGRLTAYV
jgi:hypothetical protein